MEGYFRRWKFLWKLISIFMILNFVAMVHRFNIVDDEIYWRLGISMSSCAQEAIMFISTLKKAMQCREEQPWHKNGNIMLTYWVFWTRSWWPVSSREASNTDFEFICWYRGIRHFSRWICKLCSSLNFYTPLQLTSPVWYMYLHSCSVGYWRRLY